MKDSGVSDNGKGVRGLLEPDWGWDSEAEREPGAVLRSVKERSICSPDGGVSKAQRWLFERDPLAAVKKVKRRGRREQTGVPGGRPLKSSF